MQISQLSDKQLPNIKIRSYYRNIIRGSKSINYKLNIIKSMNDEIKSNDFSISEMEDIILTGEISGCLKKMYSCMEYVAIIFRELYRGEVQSSYHKLLKKL